MSDKTSQRTEEEMLDQTFVGYDEEMTVQTEDGTKADATGAAESAGKDKKKNQNLLVYGVVGLSTLGFLGFKFLGGSSSPQQVQPQPEPISTQQQVQQPPVIQQAAPISAPVIAATTEPVPVPMPVTQPVVPPVQQEIQSASTVVDPVSQYTGNNTSLPKVDVKAEVKTEVKPESKTDVNVKKIGSVSAVNAEANYSNDKLLSQFQEMLDKKYDPKFEKIEKSMDSQKEFNKSIEERLSRLEAGKSTKVVTKSVETTDSSSAEEKSVKKIVRKPVIIRSKTETVAHNKNTKIEESEVLIDKSAVKRKVEIQKIEPVYPKIEIHSVYSGRIWTKNSDGTLSTFAVGDKLPTGEVIKKIEEDKERVTTDKRVISQ